MNPGMIESARPEDNSVLADLLADLFSMETDVRVDRDLQSRGLRMIIESPERGTILVGRTSAGTINGMVTTVQLLVSTAEGIFPDRSRTWWSEADTATGGWDSDFWRRPSRGDGPGGAFASSSGRTSGTVQPCPSLVVLDSGCPA